MVLKVVGSGSSGNCYILSDGVKNLILDAGLNIKEIKRALNYDVSSIAGALVTHLHHDHSQSVQNLLNMGVLVYMNPDLNRYYKDSYNAFAVAPFEPFKISNASCFGFDLPHDGVPNYGYFVKWGEHRVLYMTDLELCPYQLSKFDPTDLIIECNYCEDMVDMDAPNVQHKLRGHMGLKACKSFIQTVYSKSLKNIGVCHLGGDTSDSGTIKREIQTIAPESNIFICKKGLVITL